MSSNMSRSMLDGYFNPLVFWYQWDYLRSPAKKLFFLQGIQDLSRSEVPFNMYR